MKNLIKSILILSVFAFVTTSCSEDEKVYAKPVISKLVVGGMHNTDGTVTGEGTATAGKDLHIEAEIVADGKIASIEIEVHNETTNTEVVKMEYTENYVGLKNTEFHKHVDIPATTKAGTYHFHIKVVDQQGQSNTVEKDLTITAASPQ